MKEIFQRKTVRTLFFTASFCGLFYFSSDLAFAATAIYRSVGPANTTDLNTNNRTVTIVNSTATFSDAMPNNVGVGDVLQYQVSGTYYLAFIYGRTSSSVFTVKTFDGDVPQAATDRSVDVFRAYTSLQNAVNGEENTAFEGSVEDFDTWTGGEDLVLADKQWNIACYGDSEDTTLGVTVPDWVTDATRYLKIYTPYLSSEVGTSQRAAGVWDDAKYKLVVSDDFPDAPPLNINTNLEASSINVWIDGLQIMNASSSGTNGLVIYNVTGETKVSNCIIKSDPAASSTFGLEIDIYNHNGTYKIWNNIIYGFLGGGIWFQETAQTENDIYAYNNTVVGTGSDECYKSTVTGGNFIAKNNIAQSCATGFSGDFDNSSDYNLSDLSDAPGSNSVDSTTLDFVGAEDFHLASADTDAINEGDSLASDTHLPFSTDIDGQTRTGTWDIGADERLTSSIQGDVDSDGDVDIFDYNTFKSNFGQSNCGNAADFDLNCAVNIFDYNILKANFGTHS